MAASKEQIMCEIMAYLTEHPHARDTLDGITQWWLLERSILRQSPKVREALSYLVDEGMLVKYTGKNSQITYGINRSKCKEIKSLFKK